MINVLEVYIKFEAINPTSWTGVHGAWIQNSDRSDVNL